MNEEKSTTPATAETPTGKTPHKRPISHRLYERMGLNMSLTGINIFIGIVVFLLAVAIILGIVL